MLIVRRMGAFVLAVAAVIVWFALAPGDAEYRETSFGPDMITDGPGRTEEFLWTIVMSTTHTSDNTQNIFTQTVAANEEGERTSALIGLGVLGIALMAFTTERRRDTPGSVPPAYPMTFTPYPPQAPSHQ